MDLMSVAIRFSTVGDDKVRSTLAGVRQDTRTTSTAITSSIAPAKNEFGELAKAVNHVGNEFGLGLNRGLAMAGRGISEAAEATSKYITGIRAATGATTLLARAQMVAAAAGRALSGVLAAFGGPVGVALIGGLLALEKITGHLEEKAKAAADAYDAVREATQKVYEQMVAQEVGWLNTGRAIENATNQLNAYRRGGEQALAREKDWQTAFAAARAQWEAIPGNLKQASDAALLADASFVRMFTSIMKATQAQRALTNAQEATKEHEQALAAMQKYNDETAKLFEQAFMDRQKAADDAEEIMRRYNDETNKMFERQFNAQMDAEERSLEAYKAYNAETARILEQQFNERMDKIAQDQREIAGAIANAFESAFTQAFQGGGVVGAIGAFGAAILGAFGDILVRMGTAAMAAAPFIEAIRKALFSLSGGQLLAAGLGLVIAGSALGAVARSIGGAGFSGGSGGGSTGNTPGNTYSEIIFGRNASQSGTPSQATAPINVTVIGPNDPVAQRQIQEIIRNANRRGG